MEIDRIKHLAGMQLNEGKKSEYEDSAEFTDEFFGVIQDLKKNLKIVNSKRWKKWMQLTDTNYGTGCVNVNDGLIADLKSVVESADELAEQMRKADE